MSSTSVTTSWLMSVRSAAEERRDLERAFARHGRSLYRYLAVRIGADAHEVDDLMQQLWIRAVRDGASVPSGEIEFWLRAVGKNLVRQYWRRRFSVPRQVPMPEPALAKELAERLADEALPDECWQHREVRDQLALAITELNSAEQEIIVAYYFHDMSQAALAANLGISARAVEGRLYRARRALREKLRDLDV